MNTAVRAEDCKSQFQAAYENRYTWGAEFSGYKGNCILDNGFKVFKGSFKLGRDLKSTVFGIEDTDVHKSLSTQLWEVAIHRVRRKFSDVHGDNNFSKGDINEIGMKVIVTGKNEGDFYRIKNDIVTMVYRKIQGKYITIITESVTNTDKGYLSRTYTSQISDLNNTGLIQPKTHYHDTFVPLVEGGPWVLSSRSAITEGHKENPEKKLTYSFIDLNKLD